MSTLKQNPKIVSPMVEKHPHSPPLEGCPTGGVGHSSNQKTILTTINNTPIIRNFVENLPFNPALKKLVKEKRKAGILSEVLFWQQVHKSKFHNIDFDRQRIIGNYIVDFYVKALGLVIEVDGSSHNNKADYDARRQAYLESLGLNVFRIPNNAVKNDIQSVMRNLETYIIGKYGWSENEKFTNTTAAK
jgi:very-short-patch-repair endonuclease